MVYADVLHGRGCSCGGLAIGPRCGERTREDPADKQGSAVGVIGGVEVAGGTHLGMHGVVLVLVRGVL